MCDAKLESLKRCVAIILLESRSGPSRGARGSESADAKGLRRFGSLPTADHKNSSVSDNWKRGTAVWMSARLRTGYIMKAQYRMRQRYNQTLPREENDEDGGGCTSTGKAAFCCFGTLQGYILVSRVRALMV